MWVINVYESEPTHGSEPTQPTQPSQPTQPTKPQKNNMIYVAGAIILALLGAGAYELSKRRR